VGTVVTFVDPVIKRRVAACQERAAKLGYRLDREVASNPNDPSQSLTIRRRDDYTGPDLWPYNPSYTDRLGGIEVWLGLSSP
jgi:hypothetical protein